MPAESPRVIYSDCPYITHCLVRGCAGFEAGVQAYLYQKISSITIEVECTPLGDQEADVGLIVEGNGFPITSPMGTAEQNKAEFNAVAFFNTTCAIPGVQPDVDEAPRTLHSTLVVNEATRVGATEPYKSNF